MSTFSLKQVVGEFYDRDARKARKVLWDMDMLLRDGRQIATINRVPGASIMVFAGTVLSESEKSDLEKFIADHRGGVKPSTILGQVSMNGTIVDADEVEDQEMDGGDE